MVVGLQSLVNKIRKGYEYAEKWKNSHPNVVGKIPNPFVYFNGIDYIKVYTTETYFESPYSGIMELDYHDLGENYARWIEETQQKLLANKTSHERKFSQILSQSKATVVEQPYFKIGDKGYFLDFFLPQCNVAFELNGKVHKGEENEFYDLERDLVFHSIGIRTIRVSNLDIDSEDIKKKIVEWGTASLSGSFDPTLYYKRSNSRKFEGKETKYEKLHKIINDTVSKKKYIGKSLLLVTDETYFSFVLKNGEYDTSENINKELIDAFFDIVRKNNISFGVWFCGKMDNMHNGKRERFTEMNNNATQRKIDYVLRLQGNEIREEKYPYKKVRPVQAVILKNKNGEGYFSTECPYRMFTPFKKSGARKGKFRTHRICADSPTCHLCKFFGGKDEEKNLVLCKGFENKGSRNIYDNFNEKNKEFAEQIRLRLAYKETEEYKIMMKAIAERDKSRKLSREKMRQQAGVESC